MATAFGKLVRQLRADRGWLLKDLADALGVTSAYVSAVELGTKPITDSVLSGIAAAMELNDIETAQLKVAAENSPTKVSIQLKDASSQDRELVAAFAREVFDLPQERKDQLRKLLSD